MTTVVDQAEELRRMVRARAGAPEAAIADPIDGDAAGRERKTARRTRVIAVASGKGGVGKTNLAVNLGVAFTVAGKRVVVMDADLGLANVNVLLGVIPRWNLYHVIRGEKKLSQVVLDTPAGIRIIAGASGFAELANLDEEKRKRFIRGLKDIDDTDIFIVDTGAGVSNNVLSFVLAAHETIIVTSPEPTAITDAYGIIKSVAARDPKLPMRLVVNRVRSIMEAKKVSERIIGIAKQFLHVDIDSLGFIFEDENVARAVITQKPFVLYAPKSRASQCVDHIRRRLESEEGVGAKKDGIKQFLKKFFKISATPIEDEAIAVPSNGRSKARGR